MAQGALGLSLIAVLEGCATSHQIEHRHPHGTKQVFKASFNQAWRASIDAIYVHRMTILTTNLTRAGGFISAQQGLSHFSMGENVGIWVTSASPTETQVEVVSRHKGPTLRFKNWEGPLLHSVSANLGLQPVKTGSASSQPGKGADAPKASLPAASNPRPAATNVTVRAESKAMIRLRQRGDDLRHTQTLRQEQLRHEDDARRREHIQAELDYLAAEIRSVDQRLSRMKE